MLTLWYKVAPDTQPSILVVCRTVPLGEVVFSFEFNINKFLPIGEFSVVYVGN